MDELQKFYDHFAKDKKDNGWLQTPPMRLSLLAMAGSIARTIVERPEKTTTFPLSNTVSKKLLLDSSNMTLGLSSPSEESNVSYDSHSLTDSIVSWTLALPPPFSHLTSSSDFQHEILRIHRTLRPALGKTLPLLRRPRRHGHSYSDPQNRRQR